VLDDGFTLIEVVVSSAIMLVVLVIAYRFINQATVQSNTLAEMSQQQSSSRGAMSKLVGDLREAWTGVAGYDRVAGMSATTLTFYAPDRSPVATIKLRKIKYMLDAPTRTIKRSETFGTPITSAAGDLTGWTFPASDAPFVVVLTGVDNPDIFTYINTAGGPAVLASDVALVKLKFKVDRLPNKFPEPDFFETSVELRGAA
jgi:prepilin-type N-terminal cleavage/methylation domain-containing protein